MGLRLVPLDNIENILSATPQRSKPNLICDCGTPLDEGYCRNPDCPWDPIVEVYPCVWCGCCPDPKHCVWGVTCPVCGAEPKQHCHERGVIVGLHRDRWRSAALALLTDDSR